MKNNVQQMINSLCQAMWTAYGEGKVPQAIEAGEKAWALAKAASREPDLQMSEISHNLAELYRLAGRFALAFEASQRAIKIRKKLLGPEAPLVGNSLQTLAKIQDETEDLDAAKATYWQVISIRRTHRDTAEVDLAESLVDYAVLLLRREEFEASNACFREAREIFTRLGKTDTEYYCALVTNEALSCKRAGKWAQAEVSGSEALALHRKIYGENDPRSAPVFVNLAEVYREQGKLADADSIYQILDRIERQGGRIDFDVRLRRGNRGLLRADQGRYKEAIDDLLKAAECDDRLLGDVFTFASLEHMLRQAHGIIGHAYALLSLLLQHFADHADAAPLAHTLILRRKAIVQDSLAAAHKSREVGSGRLSLSLERINTEAVSKALPGGTALVEFFKYAPYRFAGYPAKGQSRWGEPRYLALVIRPDTGPIPLFDLGDASEIDKMAVGYRAVTTGRDFSASPDEASLTENDEVNKALRRRVFDPLAEALKGVNRLYLAPDSELSLLPFEVLLLDDGRYLIEDFTIIYLSSGRDVLEPREAKAEVPNAPIVMAYPNYDLARNKRFHKPTQTRPGPFDPLKGTLEEGIEVARILAVKPLLGDDAVEGILTGVHGPHILHIATHGFFLPSRAAEEGVEGPSPDRDAMRRSGLALAGANTFWKGGGLPEKAGDGILYAEDVTLLDLAGTDLVVLSACNTARGEVRAGEGIFGLRRAFVLAGARTLVMSLWRVHDTGTKELMIKFYQLLGDPKTTYPIALRSARLWLKKKHPDPAVWGGFICQGFELQR